MRTKKEKKSRKKGETNGRRKGGKTSTNREGIKAKEEKTWEN